MRKIILVIVVSAIMTAAVTHLTHVIKGEMTIKVLTVQRYYSAGGSDEFIATVKNTGEKNVTIVGYEVFVDDKASNRWSQTSIGDIQLSLEPGETQDISLGSSSISSVSQEFKVRLYVVRADGGRYTITWGSGVG